MIIVLVLAGFFLKQTSASSPIVVNSFLDIARNDGLCTLREAVSAANRDSRSGNKPGECSPGEGQDTILLPAGEYLLTRSDSGNEDANATGDLDIVSDLILQGEGADVTRIVTAGDFRDRILHILQGQVTVADLSLQGGNVKGDGGAIANFGSLELSTVEISTATASNNGGGVYNTGSLTVVDSTLAANIAKNQGGGIFNQGGLALTNVTLSGNTAIAGGGGLFNAGGSASLTNATLRENSAGIITNPGASLYAAGGAVSLKNSLLADPAAGKNCFGTLTSYGHNLSSDESCSGVLTSPTDLNAVPARLGELALNGGPTRTHALLIGSLAMDAGDETACPPTDQRGVRRPVGPGCDIGAYETGGNLSWVSALQVSPDVTVTEYLDQLGQSRWYKFAVQPNSKVRVTLTNLPANYDLTLYKDIAAAFTDIQTPQDLVRLDAEFAPDVFSPDVFSPDVFSPDAFSPDAFSPDVFSPDVFSPDVFSPDVFSPDVFSPDVFSPDVFSPDAFSPDVFSPDVFSPDVFSPDVFSPDVFSPDAFSSAQTRSLIAVSAFEGTAGEGIQVNTWNNAGDFYVRVRGRNGNFNPSAPYDLRIEVFPGACGEISEAGFPASTTTPQAGDYKTVLLVDSSRMTGGAADLERMWSSLDTLAARPEVAGVIVDVSQDARVRAANQQADRHPTCPYAKNLVAESIREIVQGYWALNPLEYVIIIGSDEVIPFFRYTDHALLANEKNYVPPVLDDTASQASLKLGYFLSQDRYGSDLDLSLKVNQFPYPRLGVGRLVESAGQVNEMLDAYLSLEGGVIAAPDSALITGYDFLEDAALAVQVELEAGTGTAADTLITPRGVSPQDPSSWNADQLRQQLFGQRHDLIFLAGHFSASSALAADYTTRLLTSDLIASSVDLQNALIFSVGCHSGYNIVDAHGVPRVTREPDWAQAFAQKGATLIAGTGYQYGDTDFVEYSERLYLEFSQQLRVGSGPVPIGKALAVAKQVYLAETPQMRGIHEKSVLQATLFGLPMLSVDLPQGRTRPPEDPSIITGLSAFGREPGTTLGLRYADTTITPGLSSTTVTLESVSTETPVTATYLSGTDGILANPVEPVLPLEAPNVSVPGYQLRGVGFRGGSYNDLGDQLLLSGAATTEVRGIHTPFLTNTFYPVKFWNVNYYDQLAEADTGAVRLNVTPAQFRSHDDDIRLGTLRQYQALNFRLYYSNNASTYPGGSIPALSAAPTIARIISEIIADEIHFRIQVIGNPSAGIQEVWVTYTAQSGPWYGTWQSLDLAQNAGDSTLWEGSLRLAGTSPEEVRYMVQAANGVGLVALSTNLGLAYVPGMEAGDRLPAALTLEASQASGAYGTKSAFNAYLTHAGVPLAGEWVQFRLGSQTRIARTGADGRASVDFPLLGLPDDYELRGFYPGSETYATASTSTPFTIFKQDTRITLTPAAASGRSGDPTLMIATLTDITGRRLSEKTLFFILSGAGQTYSEAVITDYAGRATLGNLPLLSGSYQVAVYFSGQVPLPGNTLALEDERYVPASASGSLSLLNPPTANNDTYTTQKNTALEIPAPGVLGNDSDFDNDTLSAALVSGPANGSLTLNPDGSFLYIPNSGFYGTDSFVYSAYDGSADSNPAVVTITVEFVNENPVCSAAQSSVDTLWPPNGSFVPVEVLGVTDPDGDAIQIVITSIFQDEPLGKTAPDGIIYPGYVEVRQERDGDGNGRVYHIGFRATDGQGGWCAGEIRTAVIPHDQSGTMDAIDDGALYDSTQGR